MTARSLALGVAVIAALSAAVYWVVIWRQPWSQLQARIGQIVPVQGQMELSCTEVQRKRPLVLLILGQSNAGNHGEALAAKSDSVTLFAEGKCMLAVDPLPGATGQGGSIWSRFPRHLSLAGLSRPVVLSVLAVDASAIEEWVVAGSPLRELLIGRIKSMQNAGLAPDLVLWQQGEADARRGTSADDYSFRLIQLSQLLSGLKLSAPVVLAQSTICRSPPWSSIGMAQARAIAVSPLFRPGPDTDRLQGGDMRTDGCHLSVMGLEAAAKMWSEVILRNASNHDRR